MKYSTKMNSSEDEERLYVNNKITYEQSNVQRSYKSSAILESTYKSYDIPEHYAPIKVNPEGGGVRAKDGDLKAFCVPSLGHLISLDRFQTDFDRKNMKTFVFFVQFTSPHPWVI